MADFTCYNATMIAMYVDGGLKSSQGLLGSAFELLSASRAVRAVRIYGRVAPQKLCPECRFIIYSSPRSGTNLLRGFLVQQPTIHCDSEIFLPFFRLYGRPGPVPFPFRYVYGRCLESSQGRPAECYGFVVHQYQLDRGLRMDAGRFVSRLAEEGWQIIHLVRRNNLRKAISDLIAHELGRWHVHTGNQSPAVASHTIDLQQLEWRLRWFEESLGQEQQILEGITHLHVSYEDDLLLAQNHQKTADKVFNFLDLPAMTVSPRYRRTSRDDLASYITNYDDIVDLLIRMDCERYLQL